MYVVPNIQIGVIFKGDALLPQQPGQKLYAVASGGMDMVQSALRHMPRHQICHRLVYGLCAQTAAKGEQAYLLRRDTQTGTGSLAVRSKNFRSDGISGHNVIGARGQ